MLHCLRLKEGHRFRETYNRLRYLAEIRGVLGLDRDELLDYSTIYKAFDRLKMWVWRRCCAFPRSNTPSLVTRRLTAQSLTDGQPRRVTASDPPVPCRR